VRPAPTLTALALALLAAAIPAQQTIAPGTPDHSAIAATKDGLSLPAGEFSVTDLIDAVAQFLCRNYLYDFDAAGKMRGFTLQRPLSLDALGAEELLYALLASRDLTALPIDEARGVYQVVPLSPNQRSSPLVNVPWRTPDEVLRRPRFRELVMTAVELQNVDAQQLAGALRAQFSLQGTWQPGMPAASAANPRLLLLHGWRDQLAPLIVMVQKLDKLLAPPPPANDTVLQRLQVLEQEVAALRAELKKR